MRIAPTAATAFRDQDTLTGGGEVVKYLAGLVVIDDCSCGDLYFEVVAALSLLVASSAVLSAFGSENMVITKLQKGVFVVITDEVDAAAVAAISAAGTAARNKFLAAESDAAVSAVSGFDSDPGLVDERGVIPLLAGWK